MEDSFEKELLWIAKIRSWRELSREYKLPIEFIDKYGSLLDWGWIAQRQILSEEVFLKYLNFIQDYIDYHNEYYLISIMGRLSMKKVLYHWQPHLSEEFKLKVLATVELIN